MKSPYGSESGLATGQRERVDNRLRLSPFLSPTGQGSGRGSTASRLHHRTPATPALRLASPPVRISGIGSQSRHYSRYGLESLPPFSAAPPAWRNPRWETVFLQDGDRAPESEPRDQKLLAVTRKRRDIAMGRINRHFIPPVSQSRVGKTGWWAHQGSSLGPMIHFPALRAIAATESISFRRTWGRALLALLIISPKLAAEGAKARSSQETHTLIDGLRRRKDKLLIKPRTRGRRLAFRFIHKRPRPRQDFISRADGQIASVRQHLASYRRGGKKTN